MQLKLHVREAALDHRLNLVQANAERIILIKRSSLRSRETKRARKRKRKRGWSWRSWISGKLSLFLLLEIVIQTSSRYVYDCHVRNHVEDPERYISINHAIQVSEISCDSIHWRLTFYYCLDCENCISKLKQVMAIGPFLVGFTRKLLAENYLQRFYLTVSAMKNSCIF